MLVLSFFRDRNFCEIQLRVVKGTSSDMSKRGLSDDSFTPLGSVLRSILDECRSTSGGGIVNLVQVWEDMVGSPIRENAKPFAVNGSTLLVHVSSSAWMHQLQFLKADLLETLNRGLTDQQIRDIKFKIGPM